MKVRRVKTHLTDESEREREREESRLELSAIAPGDATEEDGDGVASRPIDEQTSAAL